MTITTVIDRMRKRSDADAAYGTAEKAAGRINRALTHPCDPLDRAALIQDLALYEQEMADSHLAAFGPDPNPDEGGRDLAESLASSARLTRIVSDALYSTVFGEQVTDQDLAEPREGLTPEQWAAINYLEHAEGYAERADVLDGPMYEAFAEEMGGQAAETLVSLAYCERRAGEPGRRPYRPLSPGAMKTRARLRTTLLLATAILATVVSAGLTVDWLGTSTWARVIACLTALTTFAWLSPLPLTFRRTNA
jgi:hypothetical protein